MKTLLGPFLFYGLMALAGVIYLILSLVVAKYIHKDAIKRGINNSEFWLLIGFLLNVLGLLLYVIVRKNYDENRS